MSDTTRPVSDDPKTGTTMTQLANSLRAARDLERLRVIGILRRYPARSPETRDALWCIEREVLNGGKA